MIYFVQAVGGGPVKIGTTVNLPQRIDNLETTYRCELALLGTMEGGRDVEREIHERFSHLRFGKTEQFRPAADLMAFIGRPLLVDANPDAVEAMESPAKLVAIRCRGAWKEWLYEQARTERTTVAILIDQVMADWAARKGKPTPPDR